MPFNCQVLRTFLLQSAFFFCLQVTLLLPFSCDVRILFLVEVLFFAKVLFVLLLFRESKTTFLDLSGSMFCSGLSV